MIRGGGEASAPKGAGISGGAQRRCIEHASMHGVIEGWGTNARRNGEVGCPSLATQERGQHGTSPTPWGLDVKPLNGNSSSSSSWLVSNVAGSPPPGRHGKMMERFSTKEDWNERPS
jgi:hypothetical protein